MYTIVLTTILNTIIRKRNKGTKERVGGFHLRFANKKVIIFCIALDNLPTHVRAGLGNLGGRILQQCKPVRTFEVNRRGVHGCMR